MYETHWRLREKPFENTPDPRFLYHSQRHEEALSRILYAVKERKGAGLLTGEYGSGKTLLSRVLLQELSSERYRTALIFNPRLPTLELIKEIIYRLGGNVSSLSSKSDLIHYFNQMLYKNMDDNKDTVIVIDEAQAIPEENSFEELRLLLNFQLNENFLLTIILLGQPELKERMKELPQLKQRFAVSYHLTALAKDETKEYIQHRLEVAGSKDEIFSVDALDEIYRFSGGIPRKVNNICDLALLTGYGTALDKISKEMIREVAEDLEGKPIDREEKTGVKADG